MTIEKLKKAINENNKQFYRGSIITILGQKFSYRAEYDESLFGKLVDEAIEEKISNVDERKSK